MNSRFTITDIYSPQKMKKKRLTMKELLLLQKKHKNKILHLEKKKNGKTEILHLEKKKRGFTLAELSPQPVMRKRIKNITPPRNARTSLPPRNARTSLPPRNARTSLPPRLTNTIFTIDDIPSPKQSRSSSSHTISGSISPTPCCACQRSMKVGEKVAKDCVWCKLKFHHHKCAKKNATERKIETEKQIKSLMQNMKRITI